MKKIILLFFFMVCAFVSKSQTVFLTNENYSALKKSGKLDPKVKYRAIDNVSNATITNKTFNPNGNIESIPSAKTTTAGACQCMLPLDPTFTVVPMDGGFGASAPDWRNDDSYSSQIPLGFNFCFYGTTYTSCYINNNGNITFVDGLASFSAGGFPAGNATNLDTIMIAPFWGDVDTRNAGSGLVYYKKTPTSLIVKWNNVGYYSSAADKLNDFQLIITDGNDPILPVGKNVAFCYGDMQWTTGSASSGVNGFGGIPATVGVNKGDGANFIQIGRFDQAGLSYDGPYGLNDGISFLDNKSYFFDVCGVGNNLPPIIQDATGGGSACGDTIRICALGDTLVYTTTFLAPENTQSITVNGSAPTLGASFQPLSVTTSTAGTTTYAWMVVATPSVTGVHTVIVTGTDNGVPPLSSSATYYIKIQNLVVPEPTLSIAPAGTVCATPGATVTLTNCTDYDNVYWNNGGSGCSTISSSSGIVYVTVQKLGCYKSSSDTVVVFPNPIPVPIGPFNYCAPITSASVSLAAPSGTMPAYASYTWSPGGVNTSTASLTGTSFGTPYTITVTDVNGCMGSASFTVSSASPTLAITATPLSICGAGTTTLTASLATADSYSWSTGSTSQTTTVTAAGSYSVLISANSCTASAVTSVSVNPTPTVTLPPTVGICSGSTALVAPSSFSPAGAYTYTWSNGSHASSLSITSATVVTLQVTNLNTGCESAVSNSCNVIVASNPTVTLSSAPILFCDGANATFTSSVNGGTPAYTYSWNPASLGTNSTAVTSNAGIFSLTVLDQNLCRGTATVQAIKSTPSVSLTSPDLVICPGDCADLKALPVSTYTPNTFSWTSGTGTVDSVSVCSAGTVTVMLTDALGCTATNTITIVNDIIPVASFTASPGSPVTPNQVITFTNTSTISSGTITSVNWTFGDGGNAAGNVVNYAYPNAGFYNATLIVTGSNGCSDTVTVIYTVDAVINIPNVITPNGDNVNDYLKFNNLQFLGDNNLVIYNRWGKKIFEQANYKNDWNGGGYNDGTYFFILTVPMATPDNYSGYFQIMH